jgi:hypothetical protein
LESSCLQLLRRCRQRLSAVASGPSLSRIPFPSSFRVFSRVSRAIFLLFALVSFRSGKTKRIGRETGEKDAKRRKEILRGIQRTMLSFFSKLSEPFWRGTAWRVVACGSSGVASNAPPPYQIFLSPLPFASFRVFRGQFFSSLSSCSFGCLEG